ncbi:MAG: DUF1883 domain-containing protein [Vulcanimicrobiaceae bacterium]
MDFIHGREYLDEEDIVVINCSHQCNVLVLDDASSASYRSGGRFEHRGGHHKRFPARISVPYTGNWNVTLDLGGGSANIRYGNLLRQEALLVEHSHAA